MDDATRPQSSERLEPLAELTRAEVRDADQRQPPRAAVLHESIRREGEHELNRSTSALIWSALAAGLSMGFSFVAMGALRSMLPDRPWRPLVVSAGYTVGFLIVIIGRQQLFTENTLTPILPLLHRRDAHTLYRVLRLWGVVLLGNVLGTAIFALIVSRTTILDPTIRQALADLGNEALSGGAWVHFLRAMLSGWLIALLVWMLRDAEAFRVSLIAIITYLIGIAHLSHIVAGSVEALYVVMIGQAHWTAYAVGFFLPVLLGNILGGSAMVGALTHAQVASENAIQRNRAHSTPGS